MRALTDAPAAPADAPLQFGAYVIATAFVNDTPLFALADGTVRIGDAGAVTVAAHEGGLLAALPSADGRHLITAGDDGRVRRIDAAGATETLAEKPGKWIDQLAVGPQGAIGFASGRIAWVRLADGTIVEFPHQKAVGGLCFLPKGLRLATATVDKTVLHWVTAKGAPVDMEWKGAHKVITTSPDGRFLVTTMQEPALHGWRMDDGKHMRMSGYPGKVKSISWSAKGRYLATSGAHAAILWPFVAKDGPMGKPPLQLGASSKLVSRVACHPLEDVVAIGYDDGLILAVRFEDQAEVLLRRPGASPVSALAWDRAGFRLAWGTEAGEGGIVDLRDLPTG
jgi:WD40 repeat protein